MWTSTVRSSTIDVAAPDAVEQLLARRTRGPGSPSGIRAGGTRSARDAPRAPARETRCAARSSSRSPASSTSATRSGRARRSSGADARQQLRHRERLDDVVVGAGRKAAHALALLAARGQHDDRQRCACRLARAGGGRARCPTRRAASSRARAGRAAPRRAGVSASSPSRAMRHVDSLGLEIVAKQHRRAALRPRRPGCSGIPMALPPRSGCRRSASRLVCRPSAGRRQLSPVTM